MLYWPLVRVRLWTLVFVIAAGAFSWPGGAVSADSPDPLTLPAADGLADDLQVRDGLSRCRRKFMRQKTGAVAYLGGSITSSHGWTQLVDADLTRRFPDTAFTFVHAGIPSVDSSGHAFRFDRDVLKKGIPDLLFVEAAVNDLHNGRTAVEQRRGMEGIVRHARRANPDMDIVMLHFAEPRHTTDYIRQRVPEVIANHEAIARHYGLPSIDLAHEVQRRLSAGQFSWARDFKDLHPSPFGQQLYFAAIRRLFDQAWSDLGFCSLRRQVDSVFQYAEEFPRPQRIEWQ